jgi:multiple sugar transport system ATP-binding protein
VDLVADPAAGTFAADVQNTEYQGNTNFVHLGFDGDSMTVRTSPEFSPTAGDRVGVRFDPAEVYLFDVDTGETLRSAGGRHGPGQTTPSA